MDKLYLVLIETSGNQNYIFSTNKLKENIGASELTYRAGTKWVLEAVSSVTGTKSLSVWKDSQRLRQQLLNPALNPPIEQPDTKVEVLVAASGKALLVTKTREDAKAIIQKVTHQALIEAPGLEICGVFKDFDWEKDDLGEINKKVHRQYEQVKAQKPSTNLRFLRLPVVDQCTTSGLPASQLDDGPDADPISTVAYSKRKHSKDGIERLVKIPQMYGAEEKLISSIDALEAKFEGDDSLSWLAVIHADGNGLGEIFLKFHHHLQSIGVTSEHPNRSYINYLRKFSISLDICTERAFVTALSAFKPDDSSGEIPAVPLILGGDDLTVVADGKYALPFIHQFLQAFEQETQTSQAEMDDVIPQVAEQALGIGRLSACAGVAVVKPHFPFSVAYELSEALMKSAKQVKTKVTNPTESNQPYPCSALDFHILYDSSNVDLKRIRSHLELEQDNQKTYLYNRPYVTTPIADLAQANHQDWAAFHHWQHLERRVKALTATDESGKRLLPNSQTHDLRAGLFLGQAEANARYNLIRHRYQTEDIAELESISGSDSLFANEPGTGIAMTALMDAIDVADFLQGAANAQRK
jgi:hypothetical protein